MIKELSVDDKVRIMNADLSGIDYIIEEGTVYFKESQIYKLMENENISTADGICEMIVEQELSGMGISYDYKIIRDEVSDPGLLCESFYYPQIVEDPILESFNIIEDYIEEGTDLGKEKIWTLVTKHLAKFKKGDYKEAPTVEYRLNKCKNELDHTKRELKNFQNNPNKKQIQKMYTFGFIVKSLAALGLAIATPIIAGKVIKGVKGSEKISGLVDKASKIKGVSKIVSGAKNTVGSAATPLPKGAIKMSLANTASGALDASQYEMYLRKYIFELEACVSYLENAKKEAEKRDSEKETKNVKESFLNSSSIADIMCETGF